MTQHNKSKLSKLSSIFRSKSEQGLKNGNSSSPRDSPKNSPTVAPRRRFLRVVKDNECAGEEYENQHLIRRYTKNYWERQMEEARAIQHSVSLPYDVNTEHTILKKNTSTESETENLSDFDSPALTCKRTYFKEEVQVIEFYGGESIKKRAFQTHAAKLIDSEEELKEEDEELEVVQYHELHFKTCERQQRLDEFRLAKQNSFDEGDEDMLESCDDDTVKAPNGDNVHYDKELCLDSGVVSDVSLVSDAGAVSDTSNCSECDEPKKKQKKRRLRFRIHFLDSSNDSDKENDQVVQSSSHNKSKHYPKTISKLLRSVHLQRQREETRDDRSS